MENNEFVLSEQDLEKIAGGTYGSENQQQIPGIPCPRCHGFIPTTIYQITTNAALTCPNCLLKINIDRAGSNRAIDALRRVEEAQRKLEEKNG